MPEKQAFEGSLSRSKSPSLCPLPLLRHPPPAPAQRQPRPALWRRSAQPRLLSLAGRRRSGRKPGSGVATLLRACVRMRPPFPSPPPPPPRRWRRRLWRRSRKPRKAAAGTAAACSAWRASCAPASRRATTTRRTRCTARSSSGTARPALPLPRPAFQSLPTHPTLLPPAAPTPPPHWSEPLPVSASRPLIGPREGRGGAGSRVAG